MTDLPLITIVGPTASGKTALAVKLAEKYNGEIICADSRTIYKYMDIGTAKPSRDDRARVPHHGLDIVDPGQRFTAADFKKYATKQIDEIRRRGRVPFLVGGTGLYVDAVIFDYGFGGEADMSVRSSMNEWSVQELQRYCIDNNISLPENSRNKRYLIRAIERQSISVKGNNQPIENCFIVGIATDRDKLRNRIAKRSEQLFEQGVVEEATLLGKKYGWNSEAMTANIYRLIKLYLEQELTLAEVEVKNATYDWRLAKRQMTWFRRNSYIEWLSLEEAEHRIATLLANE